MLQKVNYYRLSAYFLTLRKEGDTFKEGVTFDQIYNLYEFDRKMRSLLMEHLERIEISLRTYIAYFLAHEYGPLGYMEGSNFKNIYHHDEFLIELDKDFMRRRRDEKFVTHYDDYYGAKYPIWLAIEVITFTQLSKLYNNMKSDDKKNIARGKYDIPYTYAENWIRVLSQLRNTCAHYARLYNKKLVVRLLLSTEDKEKICNDKLFGAIYVMKKMTIRDEWVSFRTRLEALIEEYNEVVELEYIGFP